MTDVEFENFGAKHFLLSFYLIFCKLSLFYYNLIAKPTFKSYQKTFCTFVYNCGISYDIMAVLSLFKSSINFLVFAFTFNMFYS